MARILILEPVQDVREFVARLVTRLGHEPLLAQNGGDSRTADLAVVEPSDEATLRAARALRAERPALPIVCATILPRGEIDDVCSHGYLEKPFRRADFERAISAALPT